MGVDEMDAGTSVRGGASVTETFTRRDQIAARVRERATGDALLAVVAQAVSAQAAVRLGKLQKDAAAEAAERALSAVA